MDVIIMHSILMAIIIFPTNLTIITRTTMLPIHMVKRWPLFLYIYKKGNCLLKSAMEGASKTLTLITADLTISSVVNAAPSVWMQVVANEISFYAGWWTGAHAGAVIGSIILSVETTIGAFVGGILALLQVIILFLRQNSKHNKQFVIWKHLCLFEA